MRRPQRYSVPGLTVTFDPDVCIHSAVCLKVLPAVFDVGRKRWIRPEAASRDDVVAAIRQCPSGALGYRLEAEPGPDVIEDEPEPNVP